MTRHEWPWRIFWSKKSYNSTRTPPHLKLSNSLGWGGITPTKTKDEINSALATHSCQSWVYSSLSRAEQPPDIGWLTTLAASTAPFKLRCTIGYRQHSDDTLLLVNDWNRALFYPSDNTEPWTDIWLHQLFHVDVKEKGQEGWTLRHPIGESCR